MWKEAIVAYFKEIQQICLEGLRETTKILKVVVVPAEIRKENLPNRSQNCCH
jgi:hypothetical protein